MEQNIIGEPQLSHLLEFLTELGSAADDFVLAGAQAMRFVVNEARSTRDFDFVLDVIALRETSQSISDVLEKLHYQVVPEASKFQFFKQIPDSPEIMRVEFLAPEKDKRPNNFRVDVQQNIHARACTGAEIALRESDCKTIKGTLPNGKPAQISLRVICPHALLMLKLFAMDDRYKNIRGPGEAEHDRDEARIHAADIVIIVRFSIQSSDFKRLFWTQFSDNVNLKQRTLDIISDYFANSNAPGILLYAEFLRMQGMATNEDEELKRALREVKLLLPEQDLMESKILEKSRSD